MYVQVLCTYVYILCLVHKPKWLELGKVTKWLEVLVQRFNEVPQKGNSCGIRFGNCQVGWKGKEALEEGNSISILVS